MNKSYLYIILFGFISLQSCKSLRQNILFDTDQSLNIASFESSYADAAKNYKIDRFDYIALSVYTNNGERLIDPNKEFLIGKSQTISSQNGAAGQQGLQQQENPNSILNLPINKNNTAPTSYLINDQGFANLPMVGKVKLQDLTLSEINALLSEKYAVFYEKPYVVTQYLNKRVILMGALGDKVIPLRNENMSLIEVLALAGDVQKSAKPDKIRIIRGDLKNPAVQLIDISTIKGLQQANLILQPNDIIYVESRRKFDNEALSSISTIVSLFTSTFTLLILALRL